jgi:ribosome assembly protein YihI (activator of Der GTPase)
MKIYLLNTSKGCWDDYVRIPIGIYSTKELAESTWIEYKDKINLIIEEHNKKIPIPKEEYERLFNQIEQLTEEQERLINEYDNWFYSDSPEALKINKDCWIDEMELDRTDFSLLEI